MVRMPSRQRRAILMGGGSSMLRNQWVIYFLLLLSAIVVLLTLTLHPSEVMGTLDSIQFDANAAMAQREGILHQTPATGTATATATKTTTTASAPSTATATATEKPKASESASAKPKANPTHHCLNDDFRPSNKVGVWTMLNDNMDYVKGAAKLGKAVRARTKTPLDLVVMELRSKPLGDDMWKILEPAGFLRCSVESIAAPEATRADLKEKFAVLHLWAMEVYETVVFLDADTYVQNSIDELIHMDLGGKPLGVTKDIRERKWVETFNSGVMVLHPSLAEHERLVELLYSGIQFDFVMSDQGFLNEVYKDNWHEIGFVNNANLALFRFQKEYWERHKLEDINVIHYTMQKPWKCQAKGPYGPICRVWIDAD